MSKRHSKMITALALLYLSVLTWLAEQTSASPPTARWWLTTADLQNKLAEQGPIDFEDHPDKESPAIDRLVVDDSQMFQRFLGLGTSLEHATCSNLAILPTEQRRDILTRLFDANNGIGISLARVCIGTPDFTSEDWYTYDDMPPGESDLGLTRFTIDKDRRFILPVLKQALVINPKLLYFASPWSPPGWMKSTGDMIGGHLLPEHYDAYARYFVKFIEAYHAEGIPIHAITVQNEPGVDRSRDVPKWRYPSCRWTAEQERDFIKGHLGPALSKTGLKTEIWTYDHNFNESPTADGDDPGISYPRTVLSDPDAARFVDGVAFHGYAGKTQGMSALGKEFPDVPMHFTEGSVFGPLGGRTLIDYLRHGASSYNGWVTFLDTKGQPNNGPFRASRTCITLDRASNSVNFHYDYFQYGHFFRFIRPGAHRVGSEGGDKTLASIAVQNQDGQMAVVVVNSGRASRSLEVVWQRYRLELSLPQRSIATLTWNAP